LPILIVLLVKIVIMIAGVIYKGVAVRWRQ